MTAVLGVPRPRILSRPPSTASTEAGDKAVELAARAGLHLDEWESFALRQAMARVDTGKWAAFEVGLVVPRQNGKGAVLEARELAGLFLLDERVIIHSAHLFDTAMEHFRRIMDLIESTPEFDAQVKRVSRSHGDEGVELKNGHRLRFKTRTKSGSRGLTGDLVVLDEAMFLDDTSIGALMPTLAARSVRGNPQLWYAGSAGNEESHVLARLRRRGLAGGDPSLCWLEHSVDEDVYAADPEGVAADPAMIAVANPTLGIRMSLEHALREQRSMSPAEYARERLGIGEWPADPDDEWVIPRLRWYALADTADAPPRPVGRVAFCVETTQNRKETSISVAGARPDGRCQVQVVESRSDVTWAVSRLERLSSENDSLGVVVDMQSPAASLAEDLRLAGVEVIEMHTPQAKQAFGQFYDRCIDSTVRHLNQPSLTNALRIARTRDVGDAKLWDRRTPGVTQLVSATNALWGWTTRHSSGDVLGAVW